MNTTLGPTIQPMTLLEVAQALADGKDVQQRIKVGGAKWEKASGGSIDIVVNEYRIKPVPRVWKMRVRDRLPNGEISKAYYVKVQEILED